jgi:hypothetical protein
MENTGESIYCCGSGGSVPVVGGCVITDCIRELTTGDFEIRNTSNNPILSIEANDNDVKIENKLIVSNIENTDSINFSAGLNVASLDSGDGVYAAQFRSGRVGADIIGSFTHELTSDPTIEFTETDIDVNGSAGNIINIDQATKTTTNKGPIGSNASGTDPILFIGATNNGFSNPAAKNVRFTVDGNDLLDTFGTLNAEQIKVIDGVRFNLGNDNTYEDTIDPTVKSNTLLDDVTFNSTLAMTGSKIVNGNNYGVTFTSGTLDILVVGAQRQIYKDIVFTDTTFNFTNTSSHGGEVEFIDCDFNECFIENTNNLSLYLKFNNCRFFSNVARTEPYIKLNTTTQFTSTRLEVENCFFNCQNLTGNNCIFNDGGVRHFAVRHSIFDEVSAGPLINFENAPSSTSLAEVVIRGNSISLEFSVATYTQPFIRIGTGYVCSDFSVVGNYFKNINKTNPTLIQTSDITNQDPFIFCSGNVGIGDYLAKSMNNQTQLSSQQTSSAFIEVPSNWTSSQYITGWNRGAIILDGSLQGQVIVTRPKNSVNLKISYTVRMFNNGISVFGVGISQSGSVVDVVNVNHNGPSETDKIITREFYTQLSSASVLRNFYLVFRQTVSPFNFQVQRLNFTVEEI